MDDDTIISVNSYTLCSYYTEIFFDDQMLSKATCFFTKRNFKQYLITNWHVVSGRNADTKKCLDRNAAIPNNLRIYLPKESDNNLLVFGDYVKLDLYDEDGKPKWYEMRKKDMIVDVAIIPITQKIDKFILNIEEAEEPFNEKVPLEIADEVYVIGYPFGRIGGELPIWKRGSIASEPDVDIHEMPYFFIDTATKSGMSGSPVIAYRRRNVVMAESEHGKFSRHITKLIGVYSGRIGAENDAVADAQLGRVWRASVIDEIIALNTPLEKRS